MQKTVLAMQFINIKYLCNLAKFLRKKNIYL